MVQLIDAADYELKCSHENCGKPSRYFLTAKIEGDDNNVAVQFRCADKHEMLKQVPVVTEANIEAVKTKFADRESIVVWYRTSQEQPTIEDVIAAMEPAYRGLPPRGIGDVPRGPGTGRP